MTAAEKDKLKEHFDKRLAEAPDLSSLEGFAKKVEKIKNFKKEDYARCSWSRTVVSASATAVSLAITGVSLSVTIVGVKTRGLYATGEVYEVSGVIDSSRYNVSYGALRALGASLAVASVVGSLALLYNYLSTNKAGGTETEKSNSTTQSN